MPTMMMILLCLSSALAIAISCLWPWEKFVPPALTFVEREIAVFRSSNWVVPV